jgi:DNA-binding LacI/PurR family transcriptional regulator
VPLLVGNHGARTEPRSSAAALPTGRPPVAGPLNARPRVSTRPRDARLGHQTSERVVGSLKTAKSNTNGLVIPDLTNPLFPPIVRGVDDVLRPAGYTALIVNTDNDAAGVALAVQHLADLGHRRIVHLAGPPTTSSGAGRANAFRTAVREYGLDADPALVAGMRGSTAPPAGR